METFGEGFGIFQGEEKPKVEQNEKNMGRNRDAARLQVELKSLSLLETYEHELTGKYDLYTKLVFDYTDFVMRCEDEETSGEYEIIV